MTRSAHHIRRKAALSPPSDARPWRPWRAVVVRELRYSDARLRVADQEGRRPTPQEVRRAVAVYSSARSNTHGGSVSVISSILERRARQEARRQLGLVRGGVTSDVVGEPGRHRHSARWLA